MCMEAEQRQGGRRGRVATDVFEKTPSLTEFLEDSLLVQYGMRSMARTTLLQIVATVYRDYKKDARVRLCRARMVHPSPTGEGGTLCFCSRIPNNRILSQNTYYHRTLPLY